ncbi:MAG: hypothetical protein WBV67_12960, partial [Candidatus Cybelea sp.]
LSSTRSAKATTGNAPFISPYDSRANDPANDKIWNLGGTPRPFVTISPYPNGYNCNAQGPPDAE